MDSSILHVGQQERASTSSNNDKVWKKIWALDVPNKAEHLLWRACHNSLPSNDNLMKRGILSDLTCAICKWSCGNLSHIFFYCLVAVQVWALVFLERKIHSCHHSSFELWYKEIIRSLTRAECETFAMLCYALWNNRNSALFNGKFRHPLSIVNLATHSLSEFYEANTRPVMIPPQTAPLRWSAPPSPHFKINFDAAISTAQRIFGIGAVVRDHEGSFIAGLAKKFVDSVSAEIAEAHAAREAVYLARNIMIPSFILEGDAASVIKLILDKEDILSDLGLFLEDIRLTLLDQLCIDVKWISRKANKVAHILVNRAKNVNLYESL